MMKAVPICVMAGVISLIAATTAYSGDRPYIDDRSDAAALVLSLYNAINRREYARAWDYFEEKPSKSFADFASGYANTQDVQVVTGGVTEEGAAGSIFYTVPVAIQSNDSNSNASSIYSGCYVVRQVSAGVQEPPFKPLQIKTGKLKKAKGESLRDALPADCSGVPTLEFQRAMFEKARAKFRREQQTQCQFAAEAPDITTDERYYDLYFRYSYETDKDPPHLFLLFKLACNMGAYNSVEVYYGWDETNDLRQLTFAVPEFDVKYKDEESAKLDKLTMSGFSTQEQLVNSDFDEKTESILSFSKWRGLGDASSTGTWVFKAGTFTLKSYEVDPTYDGETEAITLIKDGMQQALP